VGDSQGSMIVDIGGGTTEVAVISMSTVVVAESIRIAGDEMDEAIQRHVQVNHHVSIGEITSEKVKIEIGAASPPDTTLSFEVSGKCLVDGRPRTVCLHDQEIREMIQKPVIAIVHAVLETLEKTPPELLKDISDNGLYLAGGGALLKGLDRLIAQHTSLRVIMDNDPLTTVVRGAGMILEDQRQFEAAFIN